jgi:hypothetical protein
MRSGIGITGIKEKISLVRMGLEALISRGSCKRFALLGGTDCNVDIFIIHARH